ncbi:synaptojanin-1 isoform X1 [Lampetra planeri]
MALSKGFRVLQKNEQNLYSVILESRNREECLLFESGAIAVLSAAEKEAVKGQYNRLMDAYGCLGMLRLNMDGKGEVILRYLVLVTGCASVGRIVDSEVMRITSVEMVSLQGDPSDEDRVADLRRLLSTGTFYFSSSGGVGNTYDLSVRAQLQGQGDPAQHNPFCWNAALHVPLRQCGVDCGAWLLRVMCGGVGVRTLYAAHQQAKVCVLARVSCARAGTRFNVRGADDSGQVANFCETEQIIFIDDEVTSFVQLRGSVPLFWEQPGLQVGSHRVKMSRGYEANAPALDRHFAMLKELYGKQMVVNLLGSKEGEHMLSKAFQSHMQASRHASDIPMLNFDYHLLLKGSSQRSERLQSGLGTKVRPFLEQCGFYCFHEGVVSRVQKGTVRTNCLDCLDRTNSVQTHFAVDMLKRQLEDLGLAEKPQMVARFDEVFRSLWSAVGDLVSKMYAGTGALEGKTKLKDGARSVTRTIQNNFFDGAKQEAMDLLLLGCVLNSEAADKARTLITPTTRGAENFLQTASVRLLRSLCERHGEYTHPKRLRVAIATWNVNGGKTMRSIAFKHQTLSDWLLDNHKQAAISTFQADDTPVDVFAIGFQEMVELNAGNIVSASTENQKRWSVELQKTISRDHKYILVTSEQLVGVCLFVFLRPHHAPHVRDVAVDTVKTGMGGATGNKGGVAIRLQMYSSSLCFVCSHFAAGQSHTRERNEDYAEIARKISFPMGRGLFSHDYVFWCGDFNYRIDLSGDEVKELVRQKNWETLQQADQLVQQRNLSAVFRGFHEGRTNFPPTYKYDIFSDDYDTSEKCRIPAWTDRVLWYRHKWAFEKSADELDLLNLPAGGEPRLPHLWNPGTLIHYSRAELKTSDHRPVIALIDVDLLEVTPGSMQGVLRAAIAAHGPPDASAVLSLDSGEEFDDACIEQLLRILAGYGDVTLVRFAGNDMVVTFRDSRSALEILCINGIQVLRHILHVRLKSPEWSSMLEEELVQSAGDMQATGAMLTHNSSLLEDDASLPPAYYAIEDEQDDMADAEEGGMQDQLTSGMAVDPSVSPRPSPKPSPCPSPTHGEGRDWQSFGKQTSESLSKPAGPPAKPPPPQRPPPPSVKSQPAPGSTILQPTSAPRSQDMPRVPSRPPPPLPATPPQHRSAAVASSSPEIAKSRAPVNLPEPLLPSAAAPSPQNLSQPSPSLPEPMLPQLVHSNQIQQLLIPMLPTQTNAPSPLPEAMLPSPAASPPMQEPMVPSPSTQAQFLDTQPPSPSTQGLLQATATSSAPQAPPRTRSTQSIPHAEAPVPLKRSSSANVLTPSLVVFNIGEESVDPNRHVPIPPQRQRTLHARPSPISAEQPFNSNVLPPVPASRQVATTNPFIKPSMLGPLSATPPVTADNGSVLSNCHPVPPTRTESPCQPLDFLSNPPFANKPIVANNLASRIRPPVPAELPVVINSRPEIRSGVAANNLNGLKESQMTCPRLQAPPIPPRIAATCRMSPNPFVVPEEACSVTATLSSSTSLPTPAFRTVHSTPLLNPFVAPISSLPPSSSLSSMPPLSSSISTEAVWNVNREVAPASIAARDQLTVTSNPKPSTLPKGWVTFDG